MSDITGQIEINRLNAEVERLQKLVVETSAVAGAAVGSAEVLSDAVTQYRQGAEDLADEVEHLKHDIARHVQIATDLNSEVERLKGVLGPVLEIAERNEPGGTTWAARKALEGEI